MFTNFSLRLDPLEQLLQLLQYPVEGLVRDEKILLVSSTTRSAEQDDIELLVLALFRGRSRPERDTLGAIRPLLTAAHIDWGWPWPWLFFLVSFSSFASFFVAFVVQKGLPPPIKLALGWTSCDGSSAFLCACCRIASRVVETWARNIKLADTGFFFFFLASPGNNGA